MAESQVINISSEVSKLETVILHTPGSELERMTPENAERALYSDILNLSVATKEYAQFKGVVSKHAQAYELRDLLTDILIKPHVKSELITKVLMNEGIPHHKDFLLSLQNNKLAEALIEGVLMTKDTLTKYFSNERYVLPPLHNLFFMRDSSVVINNKVLISKMANKVRLRESLIMQAIFSEHNHFNAEVVGSELSAINISECKFEGGDILVIREDVLLIGMGARTSSEGIDLILQRFCNNDVIRHIIVQELPESPESFIHLDMVFTMLDHDKCMIYEPFILKPNKYRTVHIKKDGDKIKIDTVENILVVLDKLGISLEPLYCGGKNEQWIQEREQWHSGANFFAFEPGKVIGYGRNSYTVEEMNKNGFDILPAKDIIAGNIDINNYSKYMVTIDGAELARGGGGARCMTMPLKRV